MTFGYCLGPCVARLATGWNELEPSRLSFFSVVMDFFATTKKGMEFQKAI